METAPFASRFAELSAGLDAVLPLADAHGLSDDEVVAAALALEAHSRKVAALQLALAAEVEDRTRGRAPSDSLAAKHGCRDSVELLQRVTRSSARDVRQRVRLAALTRPRPGFSEPLPARYPSVAAALAEGDLAVESALLVTGMLERLPPSAAVEKIMIAEQCLVAAATGAIIGPEGAGDREGVDGSSAP